MVRDIKSGRPSAQNATSGFTLVELLLVLFIVALLASLVAPVVSNSVHRARETALREDLSVMRKAIDDFYSDTGKYPESLPQLVEKRYLRKIPPDPITDRNDSWKEIRGEGAVSGVVDIRSGAEGAGADGIPYREW